MASHLRITEMIDLHTHTIFSDGELVPSELVRRAHKKGYAAIGITDHVDSSNIDFVVPRIAKVAKVLNRYWDILVIPGAELTHIPLQEIKPLTKLARKLGAKIVIGHGETVSEPVIRGTNKMAILAGVDILAHPGLIKKEDVKLAKKMGVCLEITTRKNHLKTNKRLLEIAREVGAHLVLNTDSHCEDDLITHKKALAFLGKLGLRRGQVEQILANSRRLLAKLKVKK